MAIRNARTGVNISDANAAAIEVAAGKTFYSVAVPKKTGTMANVTLDPALNAYPTGYHAGAASLTAVDADLIQGNVKLGKTIFGVNGTLSYPVAWAKTIDVSAPLPTITGVPIVSGGGIGTVAGASLGVLVPSLATVSVLSPGLAVGGFVAHQQSPPVDTDETAQANNATVSDMDLMPNPATATGDGCYYGLATPYDWILTNIGTAGAGTYTITWKYWNGASFVALTIVYDETSNFKTTGMKRVNFVRPVDWAVSTIAGIANLYWVKAEAIMGTMTTQPKGTRAWVGQY